MKIHLFLFFLFSFGLVAWIESKNLVFIKPKEWPTPVYDFSKNPLSNARIELGRALFYDPILSRNNQVSCANCHLSFTAFTHVDHALSHGIEDRVGTRNSPVLINLAWNKSFMWDGSINHLDMQALAPISHPSELDEKIENVVLKLRKSQIYPKLFFNAFADSSISGEYTLKAISQFLLTLVSANSRYDSMVRKQISFVGQEINGYRIFKQNCNSCHVEPLFTNQSFENNGLAMDSNLKDLGRMKITNRSADSLKFKVPTLRNIEFSQPYMHDGRFKKLRQVIKHYASGIQKGPTLSGQLNQKIDITPDEQADLIAFLLTLSDKTFLFDPKHGYPKHILSKN